MKPLPFYPTPDGEAVVHVTELADLAAINSNVVDINKHLKKTVHIFLDLGRCFCQRYRAECVSRAKSLTNVVQIV